jgi:uncharacterized protein YbbC (DUF1343 family)
VRASSSSSSAPTPAPAASAELAILEPAAPAWPARGELSAALRARIDETVEQQLEAGHVAGAVVAIAHRGKILHERAYGFRSVAPPERMTVDTVFDLASLTKPIATASSAFALIDRGRLSLEDEVGKHLPEITGPLARVTLRELMLHMSGLPAANNLDQYRSGRAAALTSIHRLPLRDRTLVYSDLGYVVLGEVVERIAGKSLAEAAHELVFAPLGMRATFLPGAELAPRIAPTAREGTALRGKVHDPRAEGLGGVAGHAGLFGDARDLIRYALMLLGNGEAAGARVLSSTSVERMTRAHPATKGKRSFAFDMGLGGFGHTGFTGTSLWIDPHHELALVILTSRLHPDEKGDVTPLRFNLRQLVKNEVPGDRREVVVRSGLDVLAAERFARLRGRRVGLVTNSSARAADGKSAVELLAHAADMELVALFAPEHGLLANAEGDLADARDAVTRLPVFSLYGSNRRPTAAQLSGIDTLVVDLQDAGARFYTYATTIGYLLEEASKRKVRVVILDRPNPGGDRVDGPLLDADRESFIAYHRIPVQHGMTLGELARMFNAERNIAADVEVVGMSGWRRGMRFEDTGMHWTAPSPNLRNTRAALLYPGIALLEGTNVSVGRGSDEPFEQIGAPWIDGATLAQALSQAGLGGVSFEATAFTPTASVHAGKQCNGVALRIRDVAALRPVEIGIEIARQLLQLNKAEFQSAGLLTLLGNDATYRALLAGEERAAILGRWSGDIDAFRERRKAFMLYDGTMPR